MEENQERLQLISALYQKNREVYPDIRDLYRVDDLKSYLIFVDKMLRKTDPCPFRVEIKLRKKLIEAKLEIYSLRKRNYTLNRFRVLLRRCDILDGDGEEEEEEREERKRLSTEILLNYISRSYTNERLKEILDR